MESVTFYTLPDYQPYTKIFHLQQRLHALRIANHIENTGLLLEHTPVISIGRSRGAEMHLLQDPVFLKRQGIEVCSTNRGGDITYHGPGQLVVYFIITLPNQDIHWFVRNLEESVIALLKQYDIQSHRKPQYPGVWVNEEKICALGIYARKWVTMHGVALNAHPNRAHFNFIVPCGIQDKGVTSIQRIYQARQIPYRLNMEQIKQDYIKSFADTFQVEVHEGHQETLWQNVTLLSSLR